MFRIKDTIRNCYVGEPFIAFLKIKEADKGRSSDNSNESSNSFKSARSNLSESEIKQSQTTYSEQQLYAMASMLFDEGYGQYERCLKLIRCVGGNINTARVLLSEIIFNEN